LTITEARDELTSLPEQLEREPGAVIVTRRGRPALAVLPWETYAALVETLDILGDRKQMASLRRALKDIERGRVEPLAKVKRDLGL
jgi:prevent-host-death family protein